MSTVGQMDILPYLSPSGLCRTTVRLSDASFAVPVSMSTVRDIDTLPSPFALGPRWSIARPRHASIAVPRSMSTLGEFDRVPSLFALGAMCDYHPPAPCIFRRDIMYVDSWSYRHPAFISLPWDPLWLSLARIMPLLPCLHHCPLVERSTACLRHWTLGTWCHCSIHIARALHCKAHRTTL